MCGWPQGKTEKGMFIRIAGRNPNRSASQTKHGKVLIRGKGRGVGVFFYCCYLNCNDLWFFFSQSLIDTHEDGPFHIRLNCTELRCKTGNKVFHVSLQWSWKHGSFFLPQKFFPHLYLNSNKKLTILRKGQNCEGEKVAICFFKCFYSVTEMSLHMKHCLVVMWILRFAKYNGFALNRNYDLWSILLSCYNFCKEHFTVHNCNSDFSLVCTQLSFLSNKSGPPWFSIAFLPSNLFMSNTPYPETVL